MLTDLHLQKYLEGRLSDKESAEVEKMLAQNPEMQARLDTLQNQSQVLGKSTWQRGVLERSSRRGSRTRYTTLLPALLMLMVVLIVTQHWFSRPGENSTFTLHSGNGTSLEVLYNSSKGWRYLDAGFKPNDSLTISIRDSGTYHIRVDAIFGQGADAKVETLVQDLESKTYNKTSNKPIFSLDAPGQVIVLYRDSLLPNLDRDAILDLLESQGNARGGLDFQYQVFSAGQ